MLYLTLPVSIVEVLIVTVPVLLSVAFVTIAERKTMASMQRRLGPNIVGYYGLLQAFADALKLLLKEYVSPTQANLILFFLGPIITLIFSLLGYAVIPYGPGLALFDFDLGILYMLAVSSLATYGILLAGWSANSKYAFLGSLRSTAQLISYELILSSVILVVILLTSSLNLTVIIEAQKAVWFVFPLLPLFMIFFIASVAETNRAPFDLAEAESELVSGFMTEHSAVIFVFFFLAEYASLILMCILTTVLYLGGYNFSHYLTYYIEIPYMEILYNCYHIILSGFVETFGIENMDIFGVKYMTTSVFDIYSIINNLYNYLFNINSEMDLHSFACYDYNAEFVENDSFLINPILINLYSAFILGFKTILMVFVFIWIRASFPRVRFDQLMSFCWIIFLPLVFGFIVQLPCLLSLFDLFPAINVL